MKTIKKYILLPIAVISFFVLLNSCGSSLSSKNDFIVPAEKSASALTIGWYVPVEKLVEIVGPDFKPRVLKDDDMGMITLFIVKSDEHKLDGELRGPMEAAHLVIPIEKPENKKVDDWAGIDGAVVCPVNIVEQSQALGDKYFEYGFSTYTGNILLDIKQTIDKYMVTAEVNTVNGQILIHGMFEESATKKEINSAMFSHKTGKEAFFYGKENMMRIIDGKGNLELKGDNLVSAMNLSNVPFILRLDLDLTWEFDFVK